MGKMKTSPPPGFLGSVTRWRVVPFAVRELEEERRMWAEQKELCLGAPRVKRL